MFNVKLISRETIKPSRPTPEHLRYLQPSLFDHESTPILMPLIFFFSPKNNNSITVTNVLGHLKGSLLETLSVFYPLAGRAKGTYHITCNDEGVPYVEAKAINARLEDIVHKAEVSELDLLVPFDGQEGYSSLVLAIQVTTFQCGGVAIGAKISHAISDAFSLLMFVKTWTAVAANYGKGNPMLFLHPYFEICNVFPPRSPQLQKGMDVPLEPNPDLIQVKPVAKRFLFRQAKLDALRSKICSSRRNNTTPSLPMVLSALIWSRTKVACQDTRGNIPYEVFYSVNIRPKVSAPEHCYYFGNMVVDAIAKPSMKQGDDSSANEEFKLCCSFLDRVKESMERIRNDVFIRGMQEGREDLNFMMDHFERESRGEIASLGFSNLRSLPLYEADFGWGKPVWVTSATLVYKDLVILIPASPTSKDVEAYINLSSEDMAKLESDQEFLSYVSAAPCTSSKL